MGEKSDIDVSIDLSAKKHQASGHRARIRERFLKSSTAFHDYELLELLLCFAKPRVDVKPLAKLLMKRFGTFSAVIAASNANLVAVEGVGDACLCLLKLVEEASKRMLSLPQKNCVLSSSQRVLDYCRASMSHSETEQLRVLYLDNKNHLIKDELYDHGTVDEVAIYPRELMKTAMNYGATGMIVVHNHPSGDPTPSQNDIMLTHQIYTLANSLNIKLHDHIIVAKGRYFSFRAEGVLGVIPHGVLTK